MTFSTESEATNEHYFEVEMFDINKENTDLLDEDKIRNYLSFVAPVPYKNTFILRSQIYAHARKIEYNIDEYCIKINGGQIFKEYTTRLKEQSGSTLRTYDEISKLECKDFVDEEGNLIAWMWYGLSRFEKQIPIVNQMRGIRVRSSNIQLRNRLADRYTKHSENDCNQANEWWAKFTALPPDKLTVAQSIISLNKFDDGDYECNDPAVEEVLSYYKITRSIAENQQ